jgi:hypothetical protein
MKEAKYTIGLGNNDLLLNFSFKTLVFLKTISFLFRQENES